MIKNFYFIVIFTILFGLTSASAGTHAPVSVGVDRSSVPYAIGFNLGGSWVDPIKVDSNGNITLYGTLKDTSAVIVSANHFFEDNVYGSPTVGIVHKANRAFFGEASLTQGGINPSGQIGEQSWLEQYVPTAVAVGQIASGSTMGYLGGTFYSRSSDYRTVWGVASAGSEGIVAVGVNDDLDGIGAAGDFRAIRAARGHGIALTQVDGLNLSDTVVDRLPTYSGGTAYRGTVYALGITSGAANTWSDTVTISNGSPGVVTWTGAKPIHNDTPVAFTTSGTLPNPLVVGTTYFTVNANVGAKTFQVSATPGGAAIATTTSGSGVHAVTTNIAKNITAGVYFGGAAAKMRKGVVVLDDVLDRTNGVSGGGVFLDNPLKAELRWVDNAGVVQTSVWGDTGLFVVDSSAYVSGNMTALTWVAGKGFISTSGVPTLSACGTSPGIDSNSNNSGGTFTTGTGAPTACTVTFATPYPTAAFCTVTPNNTAAVGTTVRVASSNNGFTITLGAGTDGAQYYYTCSGK